MSEVVIRALTSSLKTEISLADIGNQEFSLSGVVPELEKDEAVNQMRSWAQSRKFRVTEVEVYNDEPGCCHVIVFAKNSTLTSLIQKEGSHVS